MKKNKKNQELKTLHRVANRIHELQKEIRESPRTPLPKKLFAGHWRFFSVRSDILRSSIGHQIQKIVDACNTFRLGNKKKEDSFRGCTEIAVPMPPNHTTILDPNQGLKPLCQEELDQLELSPTQKEKWFLTVTKILRAGSKNIPIPKYFPQIPKHMLEFSYKTAYITEITEPDGEKESELIKLYRFMEKNKGWEKLHGSQKDEWSVSLAKKKQLKKIQEMEIHEEL